jgi:glucan-binding YG repeat protein
MRKIVCVIAILAAAMPLFAADPFVGTWKLDPAKSKYTAGTAPKDVTIVIEEQGDSYQVAATGTYADGSPLSVKYSIPKAGGTGTVQEGPFDAITSKRVSARVRENTYTKNGKETASRRVVLSKDGKTLKNTVNGTDPKGNPLAGADVFDKQ